MENTFGTTVGQTILTCKTCGLPWIDIMCKCGKCEFEKTSGCERSSDDHRHSIDDSMVAQQTARFVQVLLDISGIKLETVDKETLDFLRYFSSVQILKENEAISNIAQPTPSGCAYYSTCTSLIKQFNSDFWLRSLKFHYVFEAKSEIHGFLNNYLRVSSEPKRTPSNDNRVIGMTYKHGDCFRSKGETDETKHVLMNRANCSDYFAVYLRNNVVLFDIAEDKAHVICEVKEVDDIVILMEEINITLSNPVPRTFEGTFEVKTDVLLFKQFLSYYLQIPVFAQRWTMKSPEKSVNDYIFRLTSEDDTSSDTDTKVYEYVKMSIEPLRKVDMIQNIFTVSFVGNDKTLLIPFIASFVALIMKLENIRFYIGRELIEFERLFVRKIQEGRFDIDRQTESFCSFRICKKKAFIAAFVSHAGNELSQFFKRFPINYRPLAIHYPIVRRLDGSWTLDVPAIIAYAIFLDSICINQIFTSAKLFRSGQPIVPLYTVDLSIADFALVRPVGVRRKNKNIFVFINRENKNFNIHIEEEHLKGIKRSQVLLLNHTEGKIALLDYPLESQLKGLEPDGRRKVNKTHTEKFAPIDSFVNNILLQYGLEHDATATTNGGQTKTTCPKLIIFSIKLLQHESEQELGLKDYAKSVLGSYENIATLLSQHLWDHSVEERMAMLEPRSNANDEELDPELQQDLLQYLFGARIIYFVFDQKENEYKFREPRHNGWYAINYSYERVMFVFKAKNENFYTCVFENVDYTSYSIPLTDKIRDAYKELRPLPVGIELDTRNCNGQLIDSYGKSVGLRIGTSIMRHSARSPIMLPPQDYQVDKRKLYLPSGSSISENTFRMIAEPRNEDDNSALLEERADYLRQVKQNLSIMFKTILKYVLAAMPRNDLDDDKRLESYLEALIVERADEFPHYCNDKIYRIAKIPTNGYGEFLASNYQSVFRNGQFCVKNAPKTRKFILVELLIMRRYSPKFFSEFAEADLDINLIRQEKNELLSLPYLEHERVISTLKTNLTSKPDIRFHNILTPDILLEERIILVRLGTSEYHLLVQTERAESETACFVCELWRNQRLIADASESRILSITYTTYTLGANGKIQGENRNKSRFVSRLRTIQNNVKVLQYISGRKNKFASLLPL
jgi:hypothetical protein